MSRDPVRNDVVEAIGDGAPFEGLQRILHVDPQTNFCIYYGLKKPYGFPVLGQWDELLTAIHDRKTVRITQLKDRAVQLIPEKDLEASYAESRDKAWARIEPLVTGSDEVRMFFAETRGILIRGRCNELSVGKNQVYADLRRYWAYGQTQSALLPDWKDRGLPAGFSREVFHEGRCVDDVPQRDQEGLTRGFGELSNPLVVVERLAQRCEGSVQLAEIRCQLQTVGFGLPPLQNLDAPDELMGIATVLNIELILGLKFEVVPVVLLKHEALERLVFRQSSGGRH
ncbi:hypothetical protein DFR24_4484 [Panacagrimonas perspica]|uniref:Uncharacterized protein n=1 Tax=Panacagrimonas perspica TaxID=381431 RepID=A0A4S3K933_9GAMM|nr:hypothetical protein [Panacagrimonas perspica]TDU24219.1 hypothetical protein DFR24_4484 [Panacagrimonas perspica]THD04628.1 hypothetical protein B1810_04215 [Panacagrimonas perspica]